MKPRRHPPARTMVRLKPGRLIRLPLRFLKQAGWRVGDKLLVQIENDHLLWTKLPEERTWRIDRLRRRTGSTADCHTASGKIRTFGDYLALRRERIGQPPFFDRILDRSSEKR